jgi:hypothetical protein
MSLDLTAITDYVENNIGDFHRRRLNSLSRLKLKKVLRQKNPYLFRAKNILTSEEFVRSITDAQISSSEETIFGDWLEGLAIFINAQVYGGQKSNSKGIDLEFTLDAVRYLVAIKSGPNWGNSSQVTKMRSDFVSAIKSLRTSQSRINAIAVNGCCYGTDNNPNKGDYFKYCGQRFWKFISGNETLFSDLIEPLGHTAKEKNEEFQESYAKVINRLTLEFATGFCTGEGAIDWEKIIKFNSAGSESTAPEEQTQLCLDVS